MRRPLSERNVVQMTGGNPTNSHNATHERAGAALQHAVAEKAPLYNEALSHTPHVKCLILGIETGGRVTEDKYSLIDALARIQTDPSSPPCPTTRTLMFSTPADRFQRVRNP